jgi:hypothetical protein
MKYFYFLHYCLSNKPFQYTLSTNLPQTKINEFCYHGSSALVGLSLFIVEVPRSHSGTSRSVGLLWRSDQPLWRPLPDYIQ